MKKGWLILIGVIAFTIVLGIGAAAGGAVTYFLLREDIPKAFAAPWVDDVKNDIFKGVIVASVVPGSAAEEAGVVRGDIILEVDNKPVNSFQGLMKILKNYDPGDSVTLTVLHGDETRTLIAILTKKDDIGFLGIAPCLGPTVGKFNFKGMPQEFEKEFKLSVTAGALVTEVVKGSPADVAGIEVGDTIISVDKEEISTESSLSELIKAHKPGNKVKFEISRDGKKKIFNIALGENPDEAGQAYLGIYYTSALDHMMFDFEGNGNYFEMPHFDFEGEGGEPFFQHKLPGFRGLESLPEGYETAIIISEVVDGTPAQESGLQVEDLILELNDKAVESLDDFVEEIKSFNPGDEISLLVYRGSEKIGVDIIVSEHPEKPGMGYLGIKVSGFMKITIEGDIPEEFEFDLEKEFELPGGGA